MKEDGFSDAQLERIEGFFEFVHERHNIWKQRVELRQPPPWTGDEILSQWRFTNIFRELDRGTIWAQRNIIAKWRAGSLSTPRRPEECFAEYRIREVADLIWYLGVYRFVNRVETFESLVLPTMHPEEVLNFIDGCGKLLESGKKVFTGAHQLFPVKKGATHLQQLHHNLLSLTECSRTLARAALQCGDVPTQFLPVAMCVDGFGQFRAAEVAKDLAYANINDAFHPDAWISPGPGCMKGVAHIMGWERSTASEAEEIARILRDGQNHFMTAETFTRGPGNQEISLCNIEHALCEYFKYERCWAGGFRPKGGYYRHSALWAVDPLLYDMAGKPWALFPRAR